MAHVVVCVFFSGLRKHTFVSHPKRAWCVAECLCFAHVQVQVIGERTHKTLDPIRLVERHLNHQIERRIIS